MNDGFDIQDAVKRGHAATKVGDFDLARSLAMEVFEHDPGNLAALHMYVSSTKMHSDDAVLARLAKFSQNDSLPSKIRSQIFFMYGKGLADAKNYKAAFDAFKTANQLTGKKSNPNATNALAKSLVAKVKASNIDVLDATLPKLVFILGMPRSGTSIMAQTLDCHSAVQSLGENVGLGGALKKAGWTSLSMDGFDQFLNNLNMETLAKIRADYLKTIDPKGPDPDLVYVDKMPENYWFAWIIPHIFPDAVIIHMKRPPLANCWSCFRHDFADGHHYSYNFNTMLAQYAIYAEMTEHWKSRVGTNWFDVELDSFVPNAKSVLNPILQTMNLPWQDTLLEPEKNTNAVSTLSKWQVRQGLNTTISDAWKNYLPFIQAEFLGKRG